MSKKNIEEIGKGVIETEASALSKLAANLPRDFYRHGDAVLKTEVGYCFWCWKVWSCW